MDHFLITDKEVKAITLGEKIGRGEYMSSVRAYGNSDGKCFCQIQFDSGERVLISIATVPTPTLKVFRLAFGGLIPRQTIWEYNPTMAGGYNAYIQNLMEMFPPNPEGSVDPLDIIRDTLLQCSSLDDARRTLLNRETWVTT
jgi:hypothetical protein